MPVRLIATTTLRYGGQLYTPGEPLLVREPQHARVLKALRRAVDEPGTPDAPIFQPAPVPEPTVLEAPVDEADAEAE